MNGVLLSNLPRPCCVNVESNFTSLELHVLTYNMRLLVFVTSMCRDLGKTLGVSINMGQWVNAFDIVFAWAKSSSLHAGSSFWKWSQRTRVRGWGCWTGKEEKATHGCVIKLPIATGDACSTSLVVPFKNPDDIHLRTVTLWDIWRKHLSTGSQWVRVALQTSIASTSGLHTCEFPGVREHVGSGQGYCVCPVRRWPKPVLNWSLEQQLEQDVGLWAFAVMYRGADGRDCLNKCGF